MKKVMYKITIILLIGIMLISSYFVFRDCKEDKKQEKIFLLPFYSSNPKLTPRALFISFIILLLSI